ncbi:hypothetical protein HS088_TW02G00598 [Tripterygium wilfordii]|uniref:Late embryogenesis abundant protein LEA-2 subgroup domain-containing protein n=1 Tax=Tripterygium wilfordii TaxID=458696 RepID=A0A7J7DZ45_TRIWF|nr:uncharacterized protein At1g08160 [Tripterygium wilfordii]KAF5751583.1 hypothetical protein HS088_TW02G00598 [Tripterygium wilfordii]
MANPPAQPVMRQRGSFNLVRCIAIILLALIVIVGLAILITWLAIKPKKLDYTIEDGSVHDFNLNYNHLNGSFDFLIRAHNPNGKLSMYYDSIEVSLAYGHQTIAFNTLEPFHQPHKNVTRLRTNLVARDISLSQGAARDMRLDKASGEVEFYVKLKARIRYKVGAIKLRHQTLKVSCSPLLHFSKYKTFERTYCDTDL